MDSGDLDITEDLLVGGTNDNEEELNEEEHQPLQSSGDQEQQEDTCGEEEVFSLYRKRLWKCKFIIDSPETPSKEYLADYEQEPNMHVLPSDDSLSGEDSVDEEDEAEQANTDSDGVSDNDDNEPPELEELGL